MYVPKPNEENDLGVLHALLRAHPLGAWVMTGTEGLVANHVPFLLDATRGAFGTLVAHVARANPVWRGLPTSAPSLVLFQGAESYITPSWYPSKHQHGKAVPTWNYAVVHARGVARAIDDAVWLRAHLERLTDEHESTQALPWKVSDAPADYVEKMIDSVVGIEIPIDALVGKWKLGQNRSEADRLGVMAGLTSRGGASAKAMNELLQKTR